MGGVDVHDQLRLQTYSLQTSFRFAKYYKSLFLGFLDMAMVNAYITHREASRLRGATPLTRAAWIKQLEKQLLSTKATDFDEDVVTPAPEAPRQKRRRSTGHTLEQIDDWVTVSGVQKRRQRSCKVCAVLRGERKKSFQTTFFCQDCSSGDAKCFLCPKARREYKGVAKTCFQIWHEDFECGLAMPPLGKRIVMRRAARTGARKRTRREILRDDDDNSDSGGSDNADARVDGEVHNV